MQAQLTTRLARSSSGLAAEADVSSSAIALPFGVPCAAALGGVAGAAVAPPLAPTGGPLALCDDVVDLDTDAPNGASPPPGDAKLPSTPSHDGGVEGGSAVALSSSSKKMTAGSSWEAAITIESDDEAVGLISTPCGDANPDRRIREVCLMIQKDMTPYGLEVLIFCQETVLKDCPKARSGGAALAAACVLQVPQETLVEWMRDAEKLFASEVPIAWLEATQPETFRKWLDVARRRRPTALALVPPDAAGDAQLAAKMCKEERFLLGMQSTSTARPNAAVMELVRWLLLDKPRPQMAFCYLQLKPVFEESGVSLDAMMPPTWASQWASRASMVTSHAFWWFGQGGQLPSEGNLVREQTMVVERYAHAARKRFGSAAAREEAREAAREAHEANKAAREAAREAAHEAAREEDEARIAAREAARDEAKIAARDAAREAQAATKARKAAARDATCVGRLEVDLTADEAMEAAALEGLELEPAGNETGFSCVFCNYGKYQARIQVLDIVLSLGTFVTPQQAALQVARHKAKGAAKAAAAGDEARVDLTAEQAMEAAKREGLELEPAGNETGFSCVYTIRNKYQAKVQLLGKGLSLGTFVTPQQAALQVARHKAKGAAKAAAAGDEARVDLTAEQAMEAAKREGLELEPAGNETGFSCVYTIRNKYQAKVQLLGKGLSLGTFVTPQQAALQVARHKAKGAAKAAAGAGSGSSGKRRRS